METPKSYLLYSQSLEILDVSRLLTLNTNEIVAGGGASVVGVHYTSICYSSRNRVTTLHKFLNTRTTTNLNGNKCSVGPETSIP